MMISVEIEYCVPCGHLNRAMDAQRHFLEEFGQRIDGVRLKTGDSGVFTIRVDGDDIYDNTQKFDINEITSTISDRLKV